MPDAEASLLRKDTNTLLKRVKIPDSLEEIKRVASITFEQEISQQFDEARTITDACKIVLQLINLGVDHEMFLGQEISVSELLGALENAQAIGEISTEMGMPDIVGAITAAHARKKIEEKLRPRPPPPSEPRMDPEEEEIEPRNAGDCQPLTSRG